MRVLRKDFIRRSIEPSHRASVLLIAVACLVLLAGSPDAVLFGIGGPGFGRGQIELKVKTGTDVTKIVAAHGGKTVQIHRVQPGPFDAIDRLVGLDRSYYLDVTLGSELAAVAAYADDPRVEYAGLEGGIAVPG